MEAKKVGNFGLFCFLQSSESVEDIPATYPVTFLRNKDDALGQKSRAEHTRKCAGPWQYFLMMETHSDGNDENLVMSTTGCIGKCIDEWSLVIPLLNGVSLNGAPIVYCADTSTTELEVTRNWMKVKRCTVSLRGPGLKKNIIWSLAVIAYFSPPRLEANL